MTSSISLQAYERLLILYPRDLRRDFAADMIEAFGEDLAAARSIGGVLRVWRSALREVMQIAVPAWFEIPEVLVPLFSAAIAAASQSPLVVLAVRRQLLLNLPAGDPILADNLIGVGIASAISALTSFLAIYRWKRAGLITLRLG